MSSLGPPPAAAVRTVEIPFDQGRLMGDLAIPARARGIVVFAHGSGSSRHSPRNRFVADVLREGGLATLLVDLLTPAEEVVDERDASLRFDILFLAQRLALCEAWLAERSTAAGLPVGYFGASTGAAAALVAAAERPERIRAVVSRGGRPDLAEPWLARVRAPTLLIVGGDDEVVLGLNEQALDKLSVDTQLEVVPGASHLFEEPGTLERVSELTVDWFSRRIAAGEGAP